MTEPDDKDRPINAGPGRGALARDCADRVRYAAEDAAWLARSRVAWPARDALAGLGTRGAIGVFGGGGIATAGVIVAIAIASSGGSGSEAPRVEAFVSRPTPARVAPAPTPKPQKKTTAVPNGPTLHGAPPSFAPAKEAPTGVAEGKALEHSRSNGSTATGDAPAARGSSAGAGQTPASTARIGTTPEASALATSRAGVLDRADDATATGQGDGTAAAKDLTTPPAPKAAKEVARHFAEAFVAYEVGAADTHVRQVFGATGTKQLSKALLKRPPRQPEGVKVPRAKVINVVAGPSRGKVYSVSVSLLRVGVTSELRLQMEQGAGKQWQVTNVLG